MRFGCYVGITFSPIEWVTTEANTGIYLAEHSLEARKGDRNKRIQKKLFTCRAPPLPLPHSRAVVAANYGFDVNQENTSSHSLVGTAWRPAEGPAAQLMPVAPLSPACWHPHSFPPRPQLSEGLVKALLEGEGEEGESRWHDQGKEMRDGGATQSDLL